jgi:two-component system sensor histidine kinase/response regulator
MHDRLPNRDRNAVLATAIDQAPVCVFVADREMRYVAVNAYACELLGYTEEELLDMRVTDIATQAEAPGQYSTLMATAYLCGVSRVRCKDGEELALSYVAGEVEIDGETAYVSVGQVEFAAST